MICQKRFEKLIFLISGVLAILAATAYAQDPMPQEYQVKAAFLYNFAKFVEWPKASPAEASPSITLCVLGEDPFGPFLDELQGKAIKGKKWINRKTGFSKNLKDCQLVFISGSEKGNLAQILGSLDGSNVLTIGDTEGFAQKGVMINFYLEEKKVRFEINIEAAKKAGLKISSNLLKLARIVQTPS